jgi:osmoprotectant transport system ATP-binding protein
MTGEEEVVRFERVSKSYAAGAPALSELDLDVRRGETLCLVGPSGCGKTTTLRLVNRLETPSSGRVLVEGRDTADWDPIALRRRIGYVVQTGGLFPHLTVERNVSLLPRLEGWDADRLSRRTTELLELVGLDPGVHARRAPRELSGGERQRVGVARALALDPPILLLDEPFGALDRITRLELQREFQELTRRVAKTILLVSHDLDEAFLLGDRVAVLRNGRLEGVGTRAELAASPSPYVARFLEGHLHAR